MSNIPNKKLQSSVNRTFLTKVAISSIPLAAAITAVAIDLIQNDPYEPLEDTKAQELIVEQYPDATNFDIEYHEDGISTMTFEVNGERCSSSVREVVTGEAGGKSSRKLTDVFPVETPIEIDCSR